MRSHLDETLRDLQKQLSEINDLEPDEIQRLRDAANEIQATLDQADVSSASLAERMQQLVQNFESTHPALTNTVGRVADLLSQLGI